LKIIKSKKRFFKQGLIEVKILKFLNDAGPDAMHNGVEMEDSFIFRKHLCIVFELLSINLYEFLKKNNFSGVSLSLVKRFAVQLLMCLDFLHENKIIH
jgi:dual specificity tyrosine-phosphorylation-regulated kinase 2/3/4